MSESQAVGAAQTFRIEVAARTGEESAAGRMIVEGAQHLGITDLSACTVDRLYFLYGRLTRADVVLHPSRIAAGVIHNVEDYSNKMGIPTVNGAVLYHQGYTANPLVFVVAWGCCRAARTRPSRSRATWETTSAGAHGQARHVTLNRPNSCGILVATTIGNATYWVRSSGYAA